MGAYEMAKDAARLASTATLGKDVIDLLNAKLALLAEQAKTLEAENGTLKAENANLKAQLQHLQPKPSGLEDDTVKILKLFFDRAEDLNAPFIAQQFQMKPSVVDYHIDLLLQKRFIRQSRVGFDTYEGSSPSWFEIGSDGRAFIVKNGMA